MDPQQELFSALLVALKGKFKEKGYGVYDGELPPEGTPYPFVYLGDVRQTDTDTKTAVIGAVYQTIHAWHNSARERGAVSAMLLDIKTACRNIRRTNNFAWCVRSVDQRILPDNSTKTPLLHGVLDVEFRFS